MSLLRRLFASPAFHVIVLTVAVAIVFARSHIVPMDDDFNYQRFIQTLAAGHIDLSIPGFHGASFLALPLYLLTHSTHANIWFQILCAIALVPAAYGAALALLRDRFQAILFAYAMALMPFYFFVALRGFTFPSFTLAVLLALMLRAHGSRWAWLPLGISFLIKPFSIALAPLFLWWQPVGQESDRRNGRMQLCFALILPLLYIAAEYAQIGKIIVGSHPAIDQTNVFQWWKFPLNIVYGFQMLFSIHNYYFPNPAATGPGNLVHASPLLLFLGTFGLLYAKKFWADRRLAYALGASVILAYALAASLDHMDHFYMQTAVLLLALAGVPLLARYVRLIPLVLFSFHFQFLYLYLQYRGVFFNDVSLFLIPLAVDVLALAVAVSFWSTWTREVSE